MDMLVSMGLALVLEALKEVVKNPAKKAALRKAMIKLRNSLLIAYPVEE